MRPAFDDDDETQQRVVFINVINEHAFRPITGFLVAPREVSLA